MMRAKGRIHTQRNISIASSFFTGANFSNVATKKPPQKRGKKIVDSNFFAKNLNF
jgi:hypothetical protein